MLKYLPYFYTVKLFCKIVYNTENKTSSTSDCRDYINNQSKLIMNLIPVQMKCVICKI